MNQLRICFSLILCFKWPVQTFKKKPTNYELKINPMIVRIYERLYWGWIGMDFCLFLNKEFNGLENMYSSSFSIDKFIYTCTL